MGPARGRRWRPGGARCRLAGTAMTDRSTLDPRAADARDRPAAGRGAPRRPAAPDDARLAEYLPEARALPRFHVWTLGCQMNRSDSEEMAGRLLAAGCEEAPSLETADLVVINTCAIREGAEQKVIGRMGQLGAAQGGQPGAARRADRLLGARAGPGRPAPPLPGGRPVPAPRRGARARRPARAGVGAGADRRWPVGATTTRRADRGRRRRPPAGTRAAAVGEGTVARGSAIARLAADHLRLRQDVHLLHRAVQPRPGAQPPVRRHRRRGAGARRRRLPRGHAARPERQLVRPRPGARAALRARRRRRAGPAAGSTSHGRPDLAELIRAIDGLRTADGRPAIGRLRFVTSHPWDLSDRLIAALADCARSASTSTCRSSRATTRSCAGWAASTRSSTTWSGSARIREAVPGIADLDRHHRRLLRRDRGAVRGDAGAARDRPLRPGLRGGLLAATRDARHAARRRRAAPTIKRRRLNELLALQEGIGLERNEAWLGREVEVLVDAVDPPRGHEHDAADAGGGRGAGSSGRTRGNKLVHLAGDEALVGRDGARSGSTTPARTRSEARSSARDRPLRRSSSSPARRRPARPSSRSGSPRRSARAAGPWRDHLGRLAPGLPRPRHRHGQGRPPRTGRASRTTASTSSTRTSRSASPTSRATPRGVLADLAARGGVAILAGGTGLYLRAVARGLDTDALPSDPAVRARLEAELDARRPRPASVARLEALAPALAAGVDLRNPRRVVRALEIAELARRRAAPAGRAATRARSPGSGLTVEPAAHRERIADPGAGPVRRRPRRRGARAARAVRPGPAGLLGDRLPRGLGGPRRRRARATTRSSSTPGATSRSPSASGPGSAPSRTSTGSTPTGRPAGRRRARARRGPSSADRAGQRTRPTRVADRLVRSCVADRAAGRRTREPLGGRRAPAGRSAAGRRRRCGGVGRGPRPGHRALRGLHLLDARPAARGSCSDISCSMNWSRTPG